MKKIRTALISVSNKKDLKPLLTILKKNRIKLISSGGTFKEIKKHKFDCLEVSEYTGSKEILEGRVKTLHPKIHAGILNKRNNKKHKRDLVKNNFQNIDLVIVNFYPFEETLKQTNNHDKILENIDIGGPAMVRAAAKNYNDVVVITSPNNYSDLINELNKNKGSTSFNFRKSMSQLAFTETAYYDTSIANYFNNLTKTIFPKKKIIQANLVEKLRYGENPHQESAVYSSGKELDIFQIHGKPLSYNNYNDIFSALSISKTFPKNKGTVIVKHANPCGVSLKTQGVDSYKSALACDPVSAFGGIVSCNFKIKRKLANELNKIFLEVIIANGFDKDSLKILKSKKNLRLIDASKFNLNNLMDFTSINNGILTQTQDRIKITKNNLKIVSKRKPNKKQLEDLIFALNVCRFVKSNAIVLVNNKSTVGIGSGQPSRLDSCKIAINKMKKLTNIKNDVVAASDAFFPFVDGIEKLVQSGVTAVIQPFGSLNDDEIIKFANNTDTILAFSKTRHFKH